MTSPLVPVAPLAPDDRAAADAPSADVSFILRLGKALHTHGYPAHRLEHVLEATAQTLGLEAQFFSTPTSLFAAFGAQDRQRTHLIRVEPGDTNLGMLAGLDAIAGDVLAGVTMPDEGLARIEALLAAPPLYGPALSTLAFVLVSLGVSALLGGGTLDAAVSALLGLITGLIAFVARPGAALGQIMEPLAAFAVSLVAASAAMMTGSTHVYLTILAGLVILLPGLMLTVGLTELSTRQLQSGTSRIAAAFVVFFGMAFGIALGLKVASWIALPGLFPLPNPALPAWAGWIAIFVAPLCFTVLLRALPRDAPAIIIASILAYGAARLGARVLGDQLGGFVGALVVTAAGNWWARRGSRSSFVTTIPGLLMLVPGSLGFSSITSLLGDQVLAGVDAAFNVAIVGSALAAGLLLGNAIIPPPDAPTVARTP